MAKHLANIVHCILTVLTASLIAAWVGGCSDSVSVPNILKSNRSFHQKFGLEARNFFADPDVLRLCRVIEDNDLFELRGLIDAGVDVNARGKDNVTPLLWAYPDNKPERFELLLAAGADPNVKLTGNLGVRAAFRPGESVTSKSAKSFFPKHFDLVMQYGGDPNITNEHGDPLLHQAIFFGAGDVHQRVRKLIECGADVNALDSAGWPPTITAIGAFQQYDVVMLLLDLGCDHTTFQQGTRRKLIHAVTARENRLKYHSPEEQASHQRLLQRLIDLGEDAEAARQDNARWSNPLGATPPLVDPFKRSWEK